MLCAWPLPPLQHQQLWLLEASQIMITHAASVEVMPSRKQTLGEIESSR
ncbi:hypothetical protein PATSB16_24660 [Pandoraea thiooxydans]|nr:hypothetical protein PATSB16_24660 [Pandoraea thiooxydans]